MFRNLFILFGSAALLVSVGCGPSMPSKTASPNTNTNTTTNGAIKLDPANMPPGLSTNPLPPSSNMPAGIPANGTAVPIGKTPTPGIPSAEQIKKGLKPGLTPTPGIPSPEMIRKQLGLPATDINTPSKPGPEEPMKKGKRKLPGRP